MPDRVYSAAYADFPVYNASREEIWAGLTTMFNYSGGPFTFVSPYLPGFPQLTILCQQSSDRPSSGDTFSDGLGAKYEIKTCDPCHKFSLQEEFTLGGIRASSLTTFSLEDISDAIIVEIERREKKNASWLHWLIFGNSYKSIAVKNLQKTLTGQHWQAGQTRKGHIAVEQADDRRLDF